MSLSASLQKQILDAAKDAAQTFKPWEIRTGEKPEPDFVGFEILGEPYAWKRAAIGKDGRLHNPIEMNRNQKKISLTCMSNWPRGFGPFLNGVILEATFVFCAAKSWPAEAKASALNGKIPHIIAPDTDNLVAQLSDGLTKGKAWIDDTQVVESICKKKWGTVEKTIVKLRRA